MGSKKIDVYLQLKQLLLLQEEALNFSRERTTGVCSPPSVLIQTDIDPGSAAVSRAHCSPPFGKKLEFNQLVAYVRSQKTFLPYFCRFSATYLHNIVKSKCFCEFPTIIFCFMHTLILLLKLR